ncbi:MAG: hypothetical protein OXG79_11260 [Chloroflexi bacterium]|nr:hypothetical protein [Chloroflexota bacterium]
MTTHGQLTFQECDGRFGWGPRYDYDVVAWSPDGSTVYFTYGWDLYGVTADGSRLWLIATGAPPESDPLRATAPATAFSVAPDGSHLVYASCRYPPAEFTMPDGRVLLDAGGGTFELVRITVDGGNVERLTANRGVDHYSAWSPDGRRIAYVSDAELVASELDAALADQHPAPPSRRIRSNSDASWVGLYTMAADGTDIRPVLDEDFAVLHQPPAWSPDGRHLAVVRYGKEESAFGPTTRSTRRQLYVVGADGAEPLRLAANVVSGPSWSPDGRRLAIAKAEEGGVGLYVIGLDGTGARRLIGIEEWRGGNWQALEGENPAEAWIDTVAWSPDGTQILVRSNARYTAIVVNVESGRSTEVGIEPGIRPKRAFQGVRAAAWSPDGSRIAMTGGGEIKLREAPQIVGTVAPDGTGLKVLALVGAGGDLVAEGAQEPDVVASQTKCADGTLVPDPAGSAGLVRDCQVLLGLRDALFGESGQKPNWSPGAPMAQWLGVTITGTPPRVTSLSLRSQDLRGTLSPALGDLTSLRTLDLAFNSFSGSIPAKLGNLSQLRRLGLASNELRGPIPPALGRLTKLEVLSLSDNYLEGAIPPQLGQLVNLRLLGLEANKLVGDIPPELGRLPKLEYVWLGGNDLTGCAPAELPVEDSASLGLPTCEPAA